MTDIEETHIVKDERKTMRIPFLNLSSIISSLSGSVTGILDTSQFHGSSSMRGRRSNAGHVRATKKHQRYRAHMRNLRR